MPGLVRGVVREAGVGNFYFPFRKFIQIASLACLFLRNSLFCIGLCRDVWVLA